MDVIIKKESEIKSTVPGGEDIKGVTKQVLIDAEDGSDKIIMRRFFIQTGGNTPYHTHDFEHVVQVESGSGIAVDKNGVEYQVQSGQSLFIRPNEKHQFKNPNPEPFQFLCIIPNPEKSG